VVGRGDERRQAASLLAPVFLQFAQDRLHDLLVIKDRQNRIDRLFRRGVTRLDVLRQCGLRRDERTHRDLVVRESRDFMYNLFWQPGMYRPGKR